MVDRVVKVMVLRSIGEIRAGSNPAPRNLIVLYSYKLILEYKELATLSKQSMVDRVVKVMVLRSIGEIRAGSNPAPCTA